MTKKELIQSIQGNRKIIKSVNQIKSTLTIKDIFEIIIQSALSLAVLYVVFAGYALILK